MIMLSHTGVPGDLDSVHLTTPLPPEGPEKNNPPIFFSEDLCTDRSQEAYPHIEVNNVTSPHTPRTTHCTWCCSVVFCLVVHYMVVCVTGMK